MEYLQSARNVSGGAVPIAGTLELVFQIVTTSQIVNFLITYILAKCVIHGFDNVNVNVEVIKPRLTTVEMDDG